MFHTTDQRYNQNDVYGKIPRLLTSKQFTLTLNYHNKHEQIHAKTPSSRKKCPYSSYSFSPVTKFFMPYTTNNETNNNRYDKNSQEGRTGT